ncbi:aminotransferase class I/II-fold pyridoxal phosphate-dependent enzyme [Eubacteriales bacterium OttesenSCG-928-G02]|nr:aminotransferase class I/II-fold pyridoxal phosphate-dependent enzyme [Eubacteriales bacterium OttesenSCG-928-G02]
MNDPINLYNEIKAKNLKLDMSRGKPSPKQLDKIEGLLNVLTKSEDCYTKDGIDCRNYGNPDGIKDIKKVFAKMLDLNEDNILVFGNSSLNIMFDLISKAWCFGICGEKPWGHQEKIKFLCPVPGYDRHFAITEHFGIEMINIPMDENGPDMDLVEQLTQNDESVKGIWCVPKYSNPTGITFSDKTVKRFAALKPAASDFRVFWDNAYCVHDLNDYSDNLLNILTEAEKHGNEDNFYIMTSTSKITFAGSGISCLAVSRHNADDVMKTFKIKTIGHDKINMLRHAKYLNYGERIKEIMDEHKKIIKPKFDLCIEYFEKYLKNISGVSWSKPNGGYFINLNVPDQTAKKIVKLAQEAGLVLTPAGASYPYGINPDDNSIRIAPTYPSSEELEEALKLLVVCVKLAV